MKVRFHPEAEQEFTEAALYYERRVAGLGEQFLSELRNATALLAEQPEMGPPITEKLRRAVLNRFPYTLIYTSDQEAVDIIAVAHQSRRPGYWRARS